MSHLSLAFVVHRSCADEAGLADVTGTTTSHVLLKGTLLRVGS